MHSIVSNTVAIASPIAIHSRVAIHSPVATTAIVHKVPWTDTALSLHYYCTIPACCNVSYVKFVPITDVDSLQLDGASDKVN